jgi:hypothetical protein
MRPMSDAISLTGNASKGRVPRKLARTLDWSAMYQLGLFKLKSWSKWSYLLSPRLSVTGKMAML